jgi:hypothetical protein
MDVMVAACANDKRLAAQGDHALDPPWPILPANSVEVGQFADVVHFAVTFSPADFAPVGIHPVQYVRPLVPQIQQPVMYRQCGPVFSSAQGDSPKRRHQRWFSFPLHSNPQALVRGIIGRDRSLIAAYNLVD